MAGERAHERALLPLGPQRRVDGPQRGLAGRGRAHLLQSRREPGADRERRPFLDGRPVGPRPGLAHVDDVDVGDVVELAPAGLAHADDGEPHAVGRVADLGPRDGERPLERGAREVGERRGDAGQLTERVRAREVGRGDAQQAGAVRAAQRVGRGARGRVGPARGVRRRRCGRRDGDVGVGVGPDGAQQLGAHGGGVRAHAAVAVGQDVEELGAAHELVAERRGGAEHGEQPLAHLGLGRVGGRGEQRADPRAGVGHGREADELEQREVRVTGAAERAQDGVAVGRQAALEGGVGPQVGGAGQVREPGPQQPSGEGLAPTGPRRRRAHASTLAPRRGALRAPGGSARARTASPGRGTRPTPGACSSGRTGRRARRASRRRARRPP
ncbi:hypothetical protein L600_004800000020 [Isoptericola variabilis J7]|nr:hypothetical protein L600_004800000020 [Isoptericola variabilis J7]